MKRSRSLLLSFLIVLIGSVLLSCSSAQEQEPSDLLPAISTWLKAHTDYGTARSVTAQPDWARGKRQQVRTSVGSYLFYLEGNEVVTVYKYSGSSREEVWRKPSGM